MVARDKEDLSGQQIGNYEIEQHIAARRASDLFLARDVKLERLVFLEVLRVTAEEDEDLAARFHRRMETVSHLKDPFIAVVSDLDVTDDGFPYAVIDYFPGTTLADRLAALQRDEEQLGVIEALELIKQIVQGLGTAHTAGLVHHDLRPENIAMREDGTPVLIDLGVPIVLGPPKIGLDSVEDEMLDYASPEELEGKELSRRSNIYSLGVILYELLAGHRPKLPNLPFDIFPQANLPKEEPLEEARPGLAGETYRLVRNCLWRQEWSRFETADEMITAIETAIFAEQELPKAAAWTPRRSRPVLVVIPIALLALGLLAIFLLRGPGRGDAEAADATALAGGTGIAGVGDATQQATSTPTATPTLELPTESSVDYSISVLSPGPNRIFTTTETLNFDWFWPTFPEPGQHFAVYLIDGSREYQLGTLTEPNNGSAYRLQVPGAELPVIGEELAWQVRLESVDGEEVLVASDEIPISIRPAAPTSTATSTPPPTVAPTATSSCVISPPPGWVQYTVRQGDSLAGLAARGNVEPETLMRVNCLPNIVLSVGQKIWVPFIAPPSTPTLPPPTSTSPPPTNTSAPPPPTNTSAPPPPTNTPAPPTDTPAPPTEQPTRTPPPPP